MLTTRHVSHSQINPVSGLEPNFTSGWRKDKEGHSRPGPWPSEDTEVGSTLDGGPGMLIRAAEEGVGSGEGGRTGESIPR